jgi:uncharacterized membrane protein
MNLWVLIGIAVMVGGFMLRLNPLLVVLCAAVASGLAGGLDLLAVIAAFGKAFNDTRYVSVVWIVLPVIGLMERHGLQERARTLIAGLKGATLPRLLTGYLFLRQATSALGLTSIAGHAQTVRPLLAPMAEAAAQPKTEQEAEEVKAMAAATDNVGLFFGEDIFIAIGSILLMKGFLEQNGIVLTPFELSVWAIPTAFAAFAIHAFRLWRMGRRQR